MKIFRYFVLLMALGVAGNAMAQTPAQLYVDGLTANSKVYDATTVTTASFASVSGIDAEHPAVIVTVDTAYFNDGDAGTAKPVSVGFAISGADASYYLAPADTTVVADIMPRQLYASGTLVAASKPYDGTTACPIPIDGDLSNYIDGDNIGFYASASFGDKYVGSNKLVTVRYFLVGLDTANYLAPADSSCRAAIVQRQLYASGTEVDTVKVYDGTTACPVLSHGTLSNIIDEDSLFLTLVASANFADKNVGSDKPVTVSYSLVSNYVSNNYLAPVSNAVYYSSVTPYQLVADSTVVDSAKVYDGTTSLGVTFVGVFDTLFATDDVVLYATATFADPHVGSGKPVAVTYTISGADTANYITPADNLLLSSSIVPKQLSAYGTTVQPQKMYDGTDTCHVDFAGSLLGVVDSDEVYVYAWGHYADIFIGNNKVVHVSYGLYGPDSANYQAPADTSLNASIVPRQLYATGTVLDAVKVYDGTNGCGVADPGMATNVVGDDSIVLAATALFTNPDVGTAKSVSVTYTISGRGVQYYESPADTVLLSSISQRQLYALGLVVKDVKHYDGNRDAVVADSATLVGLLALDEGQVALRSSAYYDDANLGHNKPIHSHYSIDGMRAFNYLAPTDSLCSTTGAIINSAVVEVDADGSYVTPTLDGFCQGYDAGLRFTISQGELVGSTLAFRDAALFASGTYPLTPVTSDTYSIEFSVPSSCPQGDYLVDVSLVDLADAVVGPFTVRFTVNYPDTLLFQPFDDVVAVKPYGDSVFAQYQWLRDGMPIAGATKPYYQDLGGLDGHSYSVRLTTASGYRASVCERDGFSTKAVRAVTVSPNPVKDRCRVSLSWGSADEHTLRVFNSHGTIVMQRSFVGGETVVDVAGLNADVYIVSVDGVTSKMVKY